MSIQINSEGVSHARRLIKAGKVNKSSDWSFDAADGNKILGDGNWKEYRKWFLAIDTDADEETKDRYKFPYGKNGKVFRRGVIAAKSRAAQQGYDNVVKVADELLEMIDKNETKVINTTIQYRDFSVEKGDIDQEKRIVNLSFSSEEPVERYFGYEILDHSSSSVDLSRLRKAGALLIDHNPSDQVGVIEEVYIDEADRKGRAKVRFGRSAKAQEVFQDVIDGIKRNVSVGYIIREMQLEKEESGSKYYRVTRWLPLEVSIVSIPADISVGIGRSGKTDSFETVVIEPGEKRENDEQNEQKEVRAMEEIVKVKEEAIKEEQKRVAEILAIGERYNCLELAKKAIAEGTSLDAFRAQVLETVFGARKVDIDPKIGMNDKEVKEFRLTRAIMALVNKDWNLAPFEKEASDAVAKRIGKTPQGFFVPYEIMTRDLVKGTTTAGGYLVATELRPEAFVEMLRNKMVVRQLGARILGGLVGDIAIPKQTGGATAYWVSEGAAPTESQQTFGQIAMTPKTVGAYTDISRKLLLQSSIDVEALVRQDIATTLALAIDLAAINGSGTDGQPTGVLNTSGVGLVSIGENGGAPTFAHMVSLETEVATDNADIGTLAYLTNAKVRGKLKTTFVNPSSGDTIVWQLGKQAGWGLVNGYDAAVSNQVPSNLTKGTGTDLSAIIFGNWGDLIIGEWGVLDILVDPYTGSAAGTVRVRALQDVDVAVRHAESFAIIVDASTT